MHISYIEVSFDNRMYTDGAPTVNIYTHNAGYMIIDSRSNLLHGHLHLHGDDPAIADIQI